MEDHIVMDARQPRPMNLTTKEVIREWVMLVVLVVSIVATAVFAGLWAFQQYDSRLVHSEADMVAGGKRFIDYSYSLDAGGVEQDQFRGLQMIVDPSLRSREEARIIKSGLIRQVKQSQMRSRIDWQNAEVAVKKIHDNGAYEIEYRTHMVRNNLSPVPINLLLYLVPGERTDENPNGVGVVGWVDYADNPFGESDNEKED